MKRQILLTAIFSFLFSGAVFFSVMMPTEFTTVYWKGIQSTDVVWFLCIWLVSVCCFYLVNEILDRVKISPLHTEKLLPSAACVYIVILLAWLPFWLAFYPGNLSPDSYSSIKQSLNGINSTAHPVFFTLFVKLCIEIGLHIFGSMNAGIAVFSVVQMLILDGILTYTVCWLKKHHVPKILLWLAVVYFALNPLIVRYSFTMWKDILFSGVMLLIVLFLYDLSTGVVTFKETKTLVCFVILAVLAAFLRNRIIYAVIGIFVVLLIVYRSLWKRLLPTFCITAALILFVQGPMYNWLNIKSSNFAEGQGVSLQQIAAVVVNDGNMTEDEKAFINQIIPLEDIPKAYKESTVDNLKGYETFNHDFLNANSGKFIKVWSSIVMKNPWTSVKAWLMTTRGFWGFNVWIEPYAITWSNEELEIHQVNFIENLTGIDLCYLSNGVLVNIEKLPFIRRFFELGTLGWFGAFVGLRLILKRQYKKLIALPLLGCILIMGERMDTEDAN
jgi:hypothetical protein